MLSRADMMDARWAYTMVSKGVKAVSILDTDLRCSEDEVEAILAGLSDRLRVGDFCYLDTVRNPELAGREFTGGTLVRPILRALRSGDGMYAVFFAATETMADLFEWTFKQIRNDGSDRARRAHVIMGLLCGYSPLAIESFLDQPLKAG